MIPMKEISADEKQLHVYLRFWLMYATNNFDEKHYREKKEECYQKYSKKFIDEIEFKVLNSSKWASFLKDKGCPYVDRFRG